MKIHDVAIQTSSNGTVEIIRVKHDNFRLVSNDAGNEWALQEAITEPGEWYHLDYFSDLPLAIKVLANLATATADEQRDYIQSKTAVYNIEVF